MTRAEIKQFFETRQACWDRRDAEALAATHAADAVAESPISGTMSGRSAIGGMYRGWFAAFPDLEFRSEDLLVDDDRVAEFFVLTGTHAGTFFGMGATGRRFEIHGVIFYHVRDGQVVRDRRIYDFTGLLLQLGVLKAKPAV